MEERLKLDLIATNTSDLTFLHISFTCSLSIVLPPETYDILSAFYESVLDHQTRPNNAAICMFGDLGSSNAQASTHLMSWLYGIQHHLKLMSLIQLI